MIKIETRIENDKFLVDYSCINTNTLEHLMLISRLVDEILEKDRENINEKKIIKFIKERKAYIGESTKEVK